MTAIDERLMKAFEHHQAGRLLEAESLYRSVLNEPPQNAHALHLVGLVCHQTGRHSEAIDLINQALALHGPHPEFHCNLAAVYQALGQQDLAETHCRTALALRPDYAEAHHNLGIALRGRRQYDEAEAEFREAIRLNPQYADAFCNLGVLWQIQEKYKEAIPPLEEAIRLAPQHAIAHNSLGSVLMAMGETEEALVHISEAIRLDPKFTRAYTNLGVGLERLQHYAEAILSYREALGIEPNDIEAHNKLGGLLLNQGKTVEASAEFKATLKLDSDNATAILNLGKLVSNGFDQFSDEEIESIRVMAQQPNLSDESRGRLHFALAQVLDKKGIYDEAFEHCRAANEGRKVMMGKRDALYDPVGQVERVDRLMTAFSPAYFERVRSFGVKSELPIFIVGMPRSGTSLTEQILASHPKVHGAGELQEMEMLTEVLPDLLGARDVGYPACVDRLEAPMARSLGLEHVVRLQDMKNDAVRVTDKAPLNYFHLGLIVTLFPRARIIHCRRNAVDTCLSCYFQNFAESFTFTHDLTSLGQYYREYERLMAYWAKVLPVPIYELNYETMTNDQEGASRKLVEYCGLEWDDRCMSFHQTERTVRTFSALQVRQPMYRTSVERWKRYEKHLQPLLAALGM